MAAIDYSGILDQIADIFAGDARTSSAHVVVEEDPQFGLSDWGSVILIYLDRRIAPPERQRMAAGRETNYHLSITIACVCFDLTSFKSASYKRNELLANVELVLMDNVTLGSKVNTSWLTGGELFSVKLPGDAPVFCAVAETTLIADVSAINT